MSLTALGKVISALAKGKSLIVPKNNESNSKNNSNFVSYRDSNLTRILQDSLGGNTNTLLIATISPTDEWAEESIYTLKFADRAKKVITKIKANKIIASNDRLVDKLQYEIRHLREILNIRMKGNNLSLEAQLAALKLENRRLREGYKNTSNSAILNYDYHMKHPLPLNSPSSYYGNKNLEFSTDVSPQNSKHSYTSRYYNSNRDSLENQSNSILAHENASIRVKHIKLII